MIDIGWNDDIMPWELDFVKLEEYLSRGRGKRGVIIVLVRFTSGIGR